MFKTRTAFIKFKDKTKQAAPHVRQRDAKSTLTLLWYDVQRDCQPCVFNELDDVCVWHADDGLSIHSQDPVAHLQLPTPVRGAALDDASYFMGHSWRRESNKVVVNGNFEERCQHSSERNPRLK